MQGKRSNGFQRSCIQTDEKIIIIANMKEKTVFWQFCFFFFFLSANSFRVSLALPFIVVAHMICIYLLLLMYDAKNCLSLRKKIWLAKFSDIFISISNNARTPYGNVQHAKTVCFSNEYWTSWYIFDCFFSSRLSFIRADRTMTTPNLYIIIFLLNRGMTDKKIVVQQSCARANDFVTGASVAHFRTSAKRLLGACRKNRLCKMTCKSMQCKSI